MIKVRKATANDAAFIHNIGSSVPEFLVNNQTVNFWPLEILTTALGSEDVLMLVAEDKNIQGFIIAQLNRGLSKATIENIFVLPEYRDKNIGETLVGTLLEELVANKFSYVATLIPTEASGASNLYEKLGFLEGETFLWLDKSLTDEFRAKKT